VTKDLPKATSELDPPEVEFSTVFDPVPESTDSLRKKLKQKRKVTQQDLTSKTQAVQKLVPVKKPAPKKTVSVAPTSRRPRWLKHVGIVGGSLAVLGLGSWIALEVSLPDTSHASYSTTVPAGSITFKDLGGAVFFQSGPISRNAFKAADMPQKVKEAFLATEDRRFYQHHGVDYQGIVRAIATNVVSVIWQKVAAP
jgi:penicillin-binding protein 1A